MMKFKITCPSTKKLQELTRPIQWKLSVHLPNVFSRLCTGASSSAAGVPPDMVTGVSWTTTRRKQLFAGAEINNSTSHQDHSKRHSSSSTPDIAEQYYNSLDAITPFQTRIQADAASSKLLKTQVSTFRGSKDRFNEFEPILKEQLGPLIKRLREEAEHQEFDSAKYCRQRQRNGLPDRQVQ